MKRFATQRTGDARESHRRRHGRGNGNGSRAIPSPWLSANATAASQVWAERDPTECRVSHDRQCIARRGAPLTPATTRRSGQANRRYPTHNAPASSTPADWNRKRPRRRWRARPSAPCTTGGQLSRLNPAMTFPPGYATHKVPTASTASAERRRMQRQAGGARCRESPLRK